MEVFLTTWGLEAFRKDGYKTNTRVSDARGSFCPGPLMELIRGMKALPVGGVLAEPTRLKLLSLLGERSHTVKDLVKAKGER